MAQGLRTQMYWEQDSNIKRRQCDKTWIWKYNCPSDARTKIKIEMFAMCQSFYCMATCLVRSTAKYNLCHKATIHWIVQQTDGPYAEPIQDNRSIAMQVSNRQRRNTTSHIILPRSSGTISEKRLAPWRRRVNKSVDKWDDNVDTREGRTKADELADTLQ